MYSTRRSFVKNGAVFATGAALAKLTPQQLAASRLDDVSEAMNAEWKAIIQHGLDAAKLQGVSYADARITFTRDRRIKAASVEDDEAIHFGIRCLVNGYWGFASSPVVGKSEMTRIAREAVLQAKANTIGNPRVVEFAKAPVVPSGNWTMPVKIDPFDVHPLDGCDLIAGLGVYAKNVGSKFQPVITLARQDKAFGSTEGSYFTQRVFRCGMRGGLEYERLSRPLDPCEVAGVGWELFDPMGMRAHIDAMIEEMKEEAGLGWKNVDVGRYPMVLDARSVGGIVSTTVGLATELDRALGYEANGTGTSYLNDPEGMVGTQKIGPPMFSVRGNRNEPGGVATVQWDDDGVVPEPFELIRGGILQRFQTTRESAGWVLSKSADQNSPEQSTGCAYAATGVDAPITRSANLVMTPADSATTLKDLYKDVKKGVMFRALDSGMDFQQLNGFGIGQCYEITNGKVTSRLANAGVLFRAPELWKSLLGIGGPQTSLRGCFESPKGQPAQRAYHSVSAVPALFEDGTIIDYTRKA